MIQNLRNLQKWKHSILTVLVVQCLVCISACSSNTPSSQEPSVATAPVESSSRDGSQRTPSDFSGVVTLIHVNDVHTHIYEDDKAIGYAKIAGFVEQMKQENLNTLFLDNGDTFSGTEASAMDKAESLVSIYNTIGFDVMTTGNHDYSYGTEHLLRLAGAVDYPVICGNMVKKDTDETILDSYILKELPGGLTVGIIGLTTPTSASMGASDLKYVDAVKVGQKLVDEVRPQADLVVVLGHVGDTEGDAMTSDKIVNEVEGIDVFIDGHSHTLLSEGKVVNDTLIAQTGEYCQNIGVVDLTFESGRLVDSKARLVTKEESADLPVKEETAQLIETFREKSEAYFAEVVAETMVHMIGTSPEIRTGETNTGSWYADVMTAAAGAELGMFKAGPIGGDIPAGPITRKDVVAINRVNSQIIVKEATGADIIEFLNYSLGTYPEPSGSFQQVSGISFVLDPEQTGEKLFDVKVNGEPIDLERAYTIATIMGSDEEPGMVNATRVKELEFSMDIMYKYLEEHPMISPQTDGRITTGSNP